MPGLRLIYPTLKIILKKSKKNVPEGVKLLGVVKADAYGHGAAMLAPTILASGIDMLGVASIDEGVDLRQAGIDCEILVLGAVPIWAVESAVKNNITISILHLNTLKPANKPSKEQVLNQKFTLNLIPV